MVATDRSDASAPTMVTVVSKDETKIACWRSGAGPALVLVHGSTADHTSWDEVLHGLAQDFTVYAMDRRGRGRSEDGPTYAVEREFEDVVAVVDSLDEPVHLLGSSYGAICALEAARLTPHIAKLVLYEPPGAEGLIPPSFLDELDDLIAQGESEEATVRFFKVVLHQPPEAIDQLRADPTWADRVARTHTVPREIRVADGYRVEPGRFADLRVPTLLLEGEVSPPGLKAATAAVHAALSHSRRVVLPGQGHGAHREAPDLFTAEVLNFLRERPD